VSVEWYQVNNINSSNVRLGNDNVSIDELLLELAVRAILVGGDDQLVSSRLEELAEAELAGDAAEELSGSEVDGLGGGQELAVRILGGQDGHGVASVVLQRLGVSLGRVLI